MRQLRLTGIAEETDFETGKSTYLLVFDRGLARIPVSEDGAKEVIRLLSGPDTKTPEVVFAPVEDNGIRGPAPDVLATFERATGGFQEPEAPGESYPSVEDSDENGVGQL